MSNRRSRKAKGSPSPKQPASASYEQESLRTDVEQESHRQDQQLANRCLAGEVGAWEELYGCHHPSLLVSIRVLLGRGSADEDLVDEISAQVWYALVANDGTLLAKYESKRGASLATFLRAVAKDLVSRHFRSERRRQRRESASLVQRPRHQVPSARQSSASLSEFMKTLSPLERDFCGDYLLAPPPSEDWEQPQHTYSTANARQLSSRIQRKLLEFVKTA